MLKTFMKLSLLITCILTSQIIAQGKILPSSEADKEFGSEIIFINMPTAELETLLTKTDKIIMFRIDSNGLQILGDDRIELQTSETISDETVFRAFSKTNLSELILLGKSEVTRFSLRKNKYESTDENILTIENGGTVLEYGAPCPPICGND